MRVLFLLMFFIAAKNTNAQDAKQAVNVLGAECINNLLITQPENQSACEGDIVYFGMRTAYGPGMKGFEQWQLSADNGITWKDTVSENENLDTLIIQNVFSGYNNYSFRRKIRSCQSSIIFYGYSDVVKLKIHVCWTGKHNTDWQSDLNWSGGKAPKNISDVNIPAGLQNYPSINKEIYCNSLNVSPGATVNVLEGGNIIITGK
ncbi:MAG: hypothetical protein QM791_08815 [Ferruginibacter sp.]